jgi:SAM-dependent methyltransferase
MPLPLISWTEDGQERSALWRCERGTAPPRRVMLADDTLPADTAYRLANEGTGLLWRGDFHNARHLLQALARRADRRAARPPRRPAPPPATPQAAFHLHRQAQAQRARVLSAVLVPFEADYGMPLRRAPDWRAACNEAWGAPAADAAPSVASLRELLGAVGAHEWRRRGVPVAALGPPPNDRIHPHYGVFSPVRGEYLDLVTRTPLPPALRATPLAMDIGTGTGVIAALLARRGVPQVLATDLDPRALACAAENIERLGLDDRVTVLQADLFAPGAAALVVCNPPWLPARPGSPLERAVYDEDSRMLRGVQAGLAAHLAPGGEGWLILSDLAEHLGLRSRDSLLQTIAEAGLQVLGRVDTRPAHAKARDPDDPLHAARAAEVTSLWRLGVVDAA